MPADSDFASLPPLLATLLVFELGLALLGAALLLRNLRTAHLRVLGLAPSGLAPSPFRATEMFLAAAFAFGGAIIFQVIAGQLAGRWLPQRETDGMSLHDVVLGGGFQLGLLAGIAHAWFWHLRPSRRVPEPDETPVPPCKVTLRVAAIEGVRTFITALPLVALTGFAWKALLDLLGVDARPQDLVALFASSGDHFALGLIIVLAVFVAPVTEELVFRIGLFRWLRTRTLRGVALLLPAFTFAVLHGNTAALLPLVALAIHLALAYERVGHPLVPVLAHSLFNLNTLVLLLAGIEV
ncbi:MAG: CPBP family intramembrane metalloprotease [Opitutaceae bacterium]|nr:CPBP family intramembrane metalloprotease [Opitutaceae bacterium]